MLTIDEKKKIIDCTKPRFERNLCTPEVSLCFIVEPQTRFMILQKVLDFSSHVSVPTAEAALDFYVAKLEGGACGPLALQIKKEFNMLRNGQVYNVIHDKNAFLMAGTMSTTAWWDIFCKEVVKTFVKWVAIPLSSAPLVADPVEQLNSAYRFVQDRHETATHAPHTSALHSLEPSQLPPAGASRCWTLGRVRLWAPPGTARRSSSTWSRRPSCIQRATSRTATVGCLQTSTQWTRFTR